MRDFDIDVRVGAGLGQRGHPVLFVERGGTSTTALMVNSVTPVVAADVVPVSADSMVMPRSERPAAMSWMMPS